MPLNILLTNDDGHAAPGLTMPYDALKAAGENVHIVIAGTNRGGTRLSGAVNLAAQACRAAPSNLPAVWRAAY